MANATLQQAAALLTEDLESMGAGCDHDVGLCVCGLESFIQGLELAANSDLADVWPEWAVGAYQELRQAITCYEETDEFCQRMQETALALKQEFGLD